MDTTYKLGEFYVTLMTYHHLMVKDIKTKRHPVIDFPAFNYFASTLIGLQKELKHVLAFGSDGDKAIIEAPSQNFPFTVQLRCFLHFKKNVEQKLKELRIPSQVSQEFLFGKRVANTFQEGLVDSCSVQQFD